MKKKEIRWALAGLPDDTGVGNVGGRPGAALGPDYFRQAFDRLHGSSVIKNNMTDMGNAEAGSQIEENHAAAATLLQSCSEFDFMIAVGGGHDLLLPLLRTKGKTGLGCINIDPHFDMREDTPQMSSGSALFTAIEQKILRPGNLLSFGIQHYANAPELADYATRKGVRVVSFDKLRGRDMRSQFGEQLLSLESECTEIILSVDLDALQAAYSPGVSAPAAEGFNPSDMITFIRLAAKSPKIRCMGIFELNPSLDIDNRTSVLAAVLAWHFAEVKLQNSL
jgi:formiminoglutamase